MAADSNKESESFLKNAVVTALVLLAVFLVARYFVGAVDDGWSLKDWLLGK